MMPVRLGRLSWACTGALALTSLTLVGACGDGSDQSSVDDDKVRLVSPAPVLRQQCESAAASLGFAVPCPTRLPLVAGKPVDCSGDCVAMAGGDATLDTIFFLNVDGYDGGSGTGSVQHLVVEARLIERAPPSPCYGGVASGRLEVKRRRLTVLDCPPKTPEADAEIMHGEGAHTEHLLGYWDQDGVRYVVSVHGSTESNRSLLRQLAGSIEIVEP